MKTVVPKLVVFDCDGVVVDSVGAHSEVMSANFAKYGLDLTPDECTTKLGAGKMAYIGEAAKKLGADLPDDWLDEIYAEIFARLEQGVSLIEGVEDVVQQLQARKIPFCLASNGSKAKMEIMLRPSGILEYFQNNVFSAHDVGHWKPEPDLFFHAANAIGVAPKDCVIIEDSETGAMGAQRAGIKCFGYAADTDPAELSAHDAIIFKSMSELPSLLGL